jgi:hypothetical protein
MKPQRPRRPEDDALVMAALKKVDEEFLRQGREPPQTLMVTQGREVRSIQLPEDPTAWTPVVLREASEAPYATFIYCAWASTAISPARLDPNRFCYAIVFQLRRKEPHTISGFRYRLDESIPPGTVGHVKEIEHVMPPMPQLEAFRALSAAWKTT